MAAPRLAALLASEEEEQAVLQAYQRSEGELVRAIQNRNTPTVCMLAKALPYKTLAAAAGAAVGVDDSSCGGVRRALAWWDPAAHVRWGEAAARDQWHWLHSQDQSLLVASPPPWEPGRHWSSMERLPRIRMSTCYVCRQPFVKGHSLGQWDAADGGHSHLCFACGLANLQELQAQEAVSLAGVHAVVTGCRHTVGYAITLRLLRCGARVLGTSRFPGAALLNYSREPDFESWRGRLELMACDFLQPAQVDALACRIAADPPHIYISNAFLTVEQSSSYYAAVRGVEQRMLPAAPARQAGFRLPRLLSRLLGRGAGASGRPPALPALDAGPANVLAAAGPPGALSPSASAGQAAGLVLSAAAQGVGAQAAAAGAWLAEQGLQLNELGNLQEGPRPTLWTDRLRDATPADLAKSAWVNQVVPARLLQVAQAAMQRAQRQSRGGAAFGLACGAAGRGGQRRLCFLINVTSTEHLHQRPTHAVTGMSKAAMETLWEKVALEQCPGIVACSADPGFVSGVTTPERKPLTAADGAARVLYPLMAWSSGRLPEDTLASVLVWKDFLPLRVVPAAKQALWALHMHPLAAALSGGPSEMASARGSAGAADVSAGKLGEPEVVQALGGWKVSMVVGSTLREVGPFAEDSAAQLVRDFIASVIGDGAVGAKRAERGGRWAGKSKRIHAQFSKIERCLQALQKRDIWWRSPAALLAGAAITRHPEVAQMVLTGEPAAAQDAGRSRGGWGLAHYAARHKSEGVLRLLQQAAQGLEDCSDVWGRYPIHYAARRNHAPTVCLLVQPAPHTALVADKFGHCALSGALYRGYSAAAGAMLEALPVAPSAALLPAQAVTGLTRAAGFKAYHYSTLVQCLLPVVPADFLLLALERSLASYEPASGPLVDVLLHHLPLTEQQWALVPPHVPGLGCAVQAVLTQPVGQAQQLAARLEGCDVLRLRRALGALCLLRVQRQLGIELPPQLATLILHLVE